jgi:oxygen-independent coproporphyrinogen-3 oxidase
VIQQLICNNTLDKRRIESQFDIEFDRYFAAELAQLAGMHADELVELGEQRLDVTARGRLLIRNICRVFDRYRIDKEEKFSKMI